MYCILHQFSGSKGSNPLYFAYFSKNFLLFCVLLHTIIISVNWNSVVKEYLCVYWFWALLHPIVCQEKLMLILSIQSLHNVSKSYVPPWKNCYIWKFGFVTFMSVKDFNLVLYQFSGFKGSNPFSLAYLSKMPL